MSSGLTLTGAHSSRTKRPGFKSPLMRRSLSSVNKSPSSSRRRTSHVEGDAETDGYASRLEDKGPVRSLAGLLKLRDVRQCLEHIDKNMFDEIPERSGMNSKRLVGIRTFRSSLPPVASLTHVYALSTSPTQAEREIAQLVLRSTVRKLTIQRRGVGSSMVGEFIVLVDRWVAAVEKDDDLSEELKRKYIDVLRSNPTSSTTPATPFNPTELTSLVRAGFLTSTLSDATESTTASFRASDQSRQGTMSSLISAAGARHASGTHAAVGGANAIYDAGGRAVNNSTDSQNAGQTYNFILPNIGMHLRLLSSARDHLLALLARSPYGEAPVDLLRERWDGGIASNEKPVPRGKGLIAPVLPGRTRKWKQFHGLNFWYVLGECFGTGSIEAFDTGSVGLGVRLTG